MAFSVSARIALATIPVDAGKSAIMILPKMENNVIINLLLMNQNFLAGFLSKCFYKHVLCVLQMYVRILIIHLG